MIPKIIHYCWFGHNPKPQLAEKCIRSWGKKCPDYQIIEWNEENYDIDSAPLYVRQAYEAKKWAFVTDYVRLQVVYENGGIYLDTDVELLKSLDKLLKFQAYFGLESRKINTGLGFGAEKGCFLVKEIMNSYQDIPFAKEDGQYDITPCPERNTKIFIKYGFQQENKKQILDNNILILPMVYLCPIDFESNKRTYSLKTISIHWYVGSWLSKEQTERIKLRQKNKRRMMRQAMLNAFLRIPVKLARFMLGSKYDILKKKLNKVVKMSDNAQN